MPTLPFRRSSARRVLTAILVSPLVFPFVCSVRAQTSVTWGNTGADFATGANWVGGVAPADSATTHTPVFDAAVPVHQPVLAASQSVAGLYFAPTAGAFTLSGPGTLTLGGSINNASTSGTQTISVPLATGPFSFSILSDGNLVMTGAFALDNSFPTLGGSGGGTLSGAISGIGGFIVDSGTWTLSNANTFTGSTEVKNGATLVIAHSLALQSSTLYLRSSSSVTFSGVTSATVGRLSETGNILLENDSSQAVALTFGGATSGNTYYGVISGSGSLNKVGATDSWLGGANTYTGGTTLTAGTLFLYHAGALGSSGSILFAGGTLGYTAADGFSAGNGVDYSGRFSTAAGQTYRIDTNGRAVTFATALTSSGGSLVKSGTNQLTLTADSTFSGTTTINGGTLQLGSGGTSGTVTGDVSIASGATLAFNRSDAVTFAQAITGAGTLAQNGSDTLTLSGSNAFTGGVALNAGKLNVGSADALGSSGTISFNGGTLQFSANNTTDYSARFSNAASQPYSIDTNGQAVTLATALTSSGGSLAKSGAGTLTLQGANTFSGGVTLNAGTLGLGSADALGSAGTISFSGGALQFTANNTTDYSARFNTSAGQAYAIDTNGQAVTLATALTGSDVSLTKLGAGTLTLTGANTYNGGTTVSAGTLAGDTTSVRGDIVNNAVVRFDQSGAGTYASIMSGTGSLVKAGSATLTLVNFNTYSGGTTVSAGTLRANDFSLGHSSGGITLAGGTLDFGNSADSSARAFSLAPGGTVTTDGLLTLSGVISGTGALSKAGSGTLTLTGANTFSGGFTFGAGTVNLGSSGALGSAGTIAFEGGTLQYSSNNTTDYSSRFSTASSQAYKINTNNQNVTFAGALTSSGGSLTKSGDGTLTLSGGNTYSGGTTINAGTLTVSSDANLGHAAGGITMNGAMLDFGSGVVASSRDITLANPNAISSSGALTLSGAIGGTGTLYKVGGGSVTLTGASTLTGGLNVNAGTIALGASERLLDTGAVTLAGGTLDIGAYDETVGALTLTSGNIAGTTGVLTASSFTVQSGTISAILGGSGALTKSGFFNTVTLSGNNTYSGGTTIGGFGGTLAVTSDAALGSGGVTFNGGTLDYGSGTITTSRDFTVLPSSSGISTSGSLTLDGTLSGTGLLSKGGAGTLTLNGTSSVSSFGVNAGTVNLGASDRFADSTGLSIAGGTLHLGAFNETVGAVSVSSGGSITGTGTLTGSSFDVTSGTISASLAGSGALTKTGFSDTVTLSGNNTYTGGTVLNEGTLVLGSPGALGSTGAITFGGGRLQFTANNTTDYSARFGGSGSKQLDTNGQSVTIANAFSGDLSKYGAGTLTLNAAQSSGAYNSVSGGTLLIGASGSLSANYLIVNNGGTVTFGRNDTFGNWASSPTTQLNINAGGLVTSGNHFTALGPVQLDGELRATGGLGASGGGTFPAFQLKGMVSAYSTPVSSITSTGAANSGVMVGDGTANGVTVFSMFNTQINISAPLENARSNADASVVVPSGVTLGLDFGFGFGAGTIVLTGANTYTGTTTINTGYTVNLGNGGATGSLGNGAIVNNGTFIVSRTNALTLSNAISGIGALTKSSAGVLTLTGTNTYTGATTVSAGTLMVNGSLADTATSIASGATLGGSGTLGGLATFASGAHLAPGNSPGTLTFANGLTLLSGTILDFDLGSTSDLIAITGGDLTGPGGTGGLTLNIFNAGDFAAGTYTLFDFATGGVTAIDFDIGDFTLGSTISGFDYSLAFDGDTLELTAAVSAVPEPSTYAAIFGGAALALAICRRHRLAAPRAAM